MDQVNNRVAGELESWGTREERLMQLFPNALSKNRGFQLEKLANLESVSVRYKGTQDPDERLALSVLRAEKRELEKKLYPNLILRLARRLIVSSVIRNRELRRAEDTGQSIEQVKNTLRGLGMDHLNTRLDEQLKSGSTSITIPYTTQINEKEKMSIEVSIDKDPNGPYRVIGYRAELHGPGKEVKSNFFNQEDGTLVSPEKSYQLLSGRSVQVNDSGNGWVQLDLNDKDAAGNYRLKQFSKSMEFDLEAAVKKLPVIQLRNGLEGLLKELTDGKLVDVTIKNKVVERKLSIEASPQSKGITIYDEAGKKISLESALKAKVNPIVISLKADQSEKAVIKKSTGPKV